MESVDFTRFIFAFLLVVGLIGLMGIFLKRYGNTHRLPGMKNDEGRIRVIEMRYIDSKRKLVLVRCDDKEHLLLLADGRETVIESDIQNKKSHA